MVEAKRSLSAYTHLHKWTRPAPWRRATSSLILPYDASLAPLSWRAACCKLDRGTKPRKPHKARPQAAGSVFYLWW